MLFKSFFPASATGERLAELVFRILDEDNGGTIGFPEIQKVIKSLMLMVTLYPSLLQTLDLCNAKTFNEQVTWAFRIFDVDNSKSIAIGEFGNSVKEIWKIFDGVGETEHNPGDSDEEN